MEVGLRLSAQLRAARGLLGWSQGELAEAAGVSRTVVARVESDTVDPRMSSIEAILGAFDEAGVMLVTEANGNFGVLWLAGAARLPDGRGPLGGPGLKFTK